MQTGNDKLSIKPGNRTRQIFSGSIWGILAKITDALAKFITIPILVSFYGKADYGLIALAFSLNAYLRLMDLGFNVGAVRYFSMWVESGELDKVGAVSRSSIIFYGVVGLINALIFIVMADFGPDLFNITANQVPIYREIMYILAFSTVLNWLANVAVQLLSAKDELGYINRVLLLSSVFNFGVALLAIYFQWSLITYFICYTLSTLIPIPFYIWRLRVFQLPVRSLITPRWHGAAFKEILTYSLAIFIMGLFQLTANNLRPLLLAKFADGTEVLTDYRVIQTIAMLIVAFGGVFMQVLLPSSAKIHAQGDHNRMERLMFEATKYISIFLALMVFGLILNANDILRLYMGDDYGHLTVWLSLWLLTVLLSMHNTPVASMVLSTGKTRFLVYSSATACLLSLPITVVLATRFQVGAAVIGYLVYMVLQIGFFYAYYIPKVLRLDGFRLFTRAFLPAAIGGGMCMLVTRYVTGYLPVATGYGLLILNSVIFVLLYVVYLFVFVIKMTDIHYLKRVLISEK
ncbi:oligosaccharide flippase family protein [Parapedobacter lycopersici]|uniref:lipopolysaccharide biosynthesis protein n=1 Tax=Parapedobacter lycopersici TaxID=1864939 RepID=UPI0033401171